MVQVNVKGRKDKLVMIVLHLNEPVTEHADVMGRKPW